MEIESPIEFELLTSSSGRRRVTMVKAKGMQDNRKQLQKGRYLSSEAIQAIQSLKKAYNSDNNDARLLHRDWNTNFNQLLKFDMLVLLREILRQTHCFLTLQFMGSKSLSGTRAASPVVAGVVCLLVNIIPEGSRKVILNPASMKHALVEGAAKLAGPNMYEQGAGRVVVCYPTYS